jgi:hypothetical protein
MSVIVLFSALQAQAIIAPAAPIKGYQEWKSEKIGYAMGQSTTLRLQIHQAQLEGNRKLAEALEKQQSQIDWNLSVDRDLSVTDYFVLYLSQQPQKDRFQQAAQRMSTAEVTELIEAYAKSLGTNSTETIVQPAPQVSTATKLPIQATQAK